MDKLRVSVIGTGGSAHVHLKGLSVKPDVEIVGLSDTAPDRLKTVSQLYPGAKAESDWRDMLDQTRPDLVAICTPNKFHAEQTLAALAIGAHVVCEKPMAMNVAEAQ